MNLDKNRLARRLSKEDAVIIGISSMIGSGIFVTMQPATASAGIGILIGIVLAAFVAFCNATSAIQLSCLNPESGGTYVFGKIHLGPFWGNLAGWVFVIGKLASCALAALTLGYYIYPPWSKYIGLGAVFSLTVLNYFGIHKTAKLSWVIVLIVIAGLSIIIFASLFGGSVEIQRLRSNYFYGGPLGILRSGALIFFAFAGFARIATLGEEVIDPRRNIPQAIIQSLIITVILYLLVVTSALLAVGPLHISNSESPLLEAVNAGIFSHLKPIVNFTAIVATLGVLLSLMLGVSRTVFAMAADKVLPLWLAKVHPQFKIPHQAQILVAIIIGVIVYFGDILSALGFSAFTILIYYAITNACALKLPKENRLWPRSLAVLGLIFCLLLAFSLPIQTLAIGLAIIVSFMINYYWRNLFNGKKIREG